ncbi:MAG: hypothetical protein Q8Q08_07135 [Candidatus Omnitrophota bacterium]|nr:hypothetical protein [Candidatus Omnitrophota bacterium]MDZ4242721.1 hypothetical protein [Candidatus Omnitrophota bacterium]
MKKIATIGVLIIGVLLAVNWLMFLWSGPSVQQPVYVYRPPAETARRPGLVQGPVVRKNTVIPGMEYEESVFYAGDKEIARQKMIGRHILETTGQIPDGKVKFIDGYRQVTGEEFFRKGKRHGTSVTYYPDGKIRAQAEYVHGKLLTNTEYYQDGTVRMEEDYTDAREFPGTWTRETGLGKVYFSSGTLKYEWSFTNTNPVGYKKSYNQEGQMTLEAYFDKDGNVLSSVN